MKKTFLLAVLCLPVICCFGLQSCGGGAGHPAAKIETDIWKALGNGDAEKAHRIIKDHYWSLRPDYYSEVEVTRKAKQMAELIKDKAEGIEKIEVVSVEPATRRSSYTEREGWEEYVEVILRITFGNGDVLYSKENYETNGKVWERISDGFDLTAEGML